MELMCSGCVYFRQFGTSEGKCHRNPVVIQVSVGHWCGEFKTNAPQQQPKPQPQQYKRR